MMASHHTAPRSIVRLRMLLRRLEIARGRVTRLGSGLECLGPESLARSYRISDCGKPCVIGRCKHTISPEDVDLTGPHKRGLWL